MFSKIVRYWYRFSTLFARYFEIRIDQFVRKSQYVILNKLSGFAELFDWLFSKTVSYCNPILVFMFNFSPSKIQPKFWAIESTGFCAHFVHLTNTGDSRDNLILYNRENVQCLDTILDSPSAEHEENISAQVSGLFRADFAVKFTYRIFFSMSPRGWFGNPFKRAM